MHIKNRLFEKLRLEFIVNLKEIYIWRQLYSKENTNWQFQTKYIRFYANMLTKIPYTVVRKFERIVCRNIYFLYEFL